MAPPVLLSLVILATVSAVSGASRRAVLHKSISHQIPRKALSSSAIWEVMPSQSAIPQVADDVEEFVYYGCHQFSDGDDPDMALNTDLLDKDDPNNKISTLLEGDIYACRFSCLKGSSTDSESSDYLFFGVKLGACWCGRNFELLPIDGLDESVCKQSLCDNGVQYCGAPSAIRIFSIQPLEKKQQGGTHAAS